MIIYRRYSLDKFDIDQITRQIDEMIYVGLVILSISVSNENKRYIDGSLIKGEMREVHHIYAYAKESVAFMKFLKFEEELKKASDQTEEITNET